MKVSPSQPHREIGDVREDGLTKNKSKHLHLLDCLYNLIINIDAKYNL